MAIGTGSAIALGIAATAGIASSAASAASSSSAAKSQADAQKQALNNITSLTNEQLELNKQQLDNFQSLYGNLEQTLSSYANNLSAAQYEAYNIGNIQASYNESMATLNKTLSQRGLANSGAATAGLTTLSSNAAQAIADVKRTSAAAVASEQANILQLGLNQKNNALANMNNAYSNAINANQYQANLAGQNQAMYNSQTASSIAGIGSTIGNTIGTGLTLGALQSNNKKQ